MGWCIVQTNDYDQQGKTYPTICTHHKLHNNNETNAWFSWNVYALSDRIWCNKHFRHTTTEKYDNNGKGGYFRFDDDNNMSYRYITLAIDMYCLIIHRFGQSVTMIVVVTMDNLMPESSVLKITWWRHQMETFSALLAICTGNSPVTKARDSELWCSLWSAPE